ncbi:bZIP transcription factor [Legionella feeleii]|uniref:BZIP transcription factor n=1 Tax=Legionella feeleii TaxID=453 RepID=A0A0W0U0F9_9GAMM|nr:bZIP transcription factor [Legionella feeleii]KTD01231.1 bZIP transcription factor [Legionella feeleii]SPX60537.1 bZIP transcription factor [Legionella feeleii]
MLEFYQTQQTTQHFLATFLALDPHEFAAKGDLIALTNLQSSLLEFLIGALKNPSSTPAEVSMKVWEDYSSNYREQQRLLAPVVSAEYAEFYLPELVLPATPIKKEEAEEEEVLLQGAIGFQLEEPTFINTSLSGFETDSSSQQPSMTSKINRVNRSISRNDLVSPYAFFPLPDKTDKNGKEMEKYGLYEQQVESLKARKKSLSVEEKRELRRLSNLLSARKSRFHKKEHLHELETALAQSKEQNEALQETYHRLSSEQQMLKKELAELMSMVVQAGVDPESWLKQVMVSPVKNNEEQIHHTPFQPD